MALVPLPPQPRRGRGMPQEPLAAYPVFSTQQLDVAEHHIGELYSAHKMHLLGSREFTGALNGAEVGSALVSSFSFKASVLIDCPALDVYIVNLPLGASLMPIRHRGVETVSSSRVAAVCSAGDAALAQFIPGCQPRREDDNTYRMLSVRLQREVMERHLSRMLGRAVRDAVRFDIELDVAGAGASWRGALAMALSVLSKQAGLIQRPLVAAELEHALYSTLLLSQPHNYTRDLTEPPNAVREPRAVRTARELIESLPQQPHTPASLAEAADVSVRTLQTAFKRHLGTSPTAYIREVRLKCAHDDLQHVTRRDVTVTEVALQWGFLHLGRFAAAYRERYGVSPSQTLRRARRERF